MGYDEGTLYDYYDSRAGLRVGGHELGLHNAAYVLVGQYTQLLNYDNYGKDYNTSCVAHMYRPIVSLPRRCG